MDPLIGKHFGSASSKDAEQTHANGVAQFAQSTRDRYLVKSLLGKQTGRRTYLAFDNSCLQTVVIKLVLFGPDFTWADLRLFEREAETLKSLNHSAIPKYLDSFEVETPMGKGFALVQTYIDASSLQQQANAGRTFNESDLIEIAHQSLSILKKLHTRHPPIIHRDIKPSNILVTNRDDGSVNKVYLIDFGSVQTTPSNGTMTIVGTYGYMPIEQFGGRAFPASDLYSLGATLIYLATGKHPADLVTPALQLDFKQHTHFTPAFANWIERLVQSDLSQRTASATAALRSLPLIAATHPSSSKASRSTHNKSALDKSTQSNSASIALSPSKKSLEDASRKPNSLKDKQSSAISQQQKEHLFEDSKLKPQPKHQSFSHRKDIDIFYHARLRLNDLEVSVEEDALLIHLFPSRLREERVQDILSNTVFPIAACALFLWLIFLSSSVLGIFFLFLTIVFAGLFMKEHNQTLSGQSYRKASIRLQVPSAEKGGRVSFIFPSQPSAQPYKANRNTMANSPVRYPLRTVKADLFSRKLYFIFDGAGRTHRKLSVSGSRQEIQFLSQRISKQTCKPILFWERAFSALYTHSLDFEMADNREPYQFTSLPRLFYRRHP